MTPTQLNERMSRIWRDRSWAGTGVFCDPRFWACGTQVDTVEDLFGVVVVVLERRETRESLYWGGIKK